MLIDEIAVRDTNAFGVRDDRRSGRRLHFEAIGVWDFHRSESGRDQRTVAVRTRTSYDGSLKKPQQALIGVEGRLASVRLLINSLTGKAIVLSWH